MFKYVPMGGLVIAFKDYSPFKGIWGSEWCGFANFQKFFSNTDFTKLLTNTLGISLLQLVLYFPAPIILSLFLNEVKHSGYKRVVQTLVYIPHFVSWVIVASLTYQLFNVTDGIINMIYQSITGSTFDILAKVYRAYGLYDTYWALILPGLISPFNMIIIKKFFQGLPVELEEASYVDGANDLQIFLKVALPLSKPVIASISLFYGVGFWNDYFSSMIYLQTASKYPNLSKMSKEVAANLSVDGKLIAIPRTRVVGRYGLSYRQDWAEALGVELPENATPDDVYNMLYAFTYNDPDGNGQDDTIGMEMTSYTGPFDIIQTWFGCGNGWQDVDGQLMPVWTTDNYFEAVEYIKKLYDDGLMPKDFYSRPTDTWSNGCKTGENGVFIDVLDSGKRIWQYFEAEETLTPSVIDASVPATMK